MNFQREKMLKCRKLAAVFEEVHPKANVLPTPMGGVAQHVPSNNLLELATLLIHKYKCMYIG